MTNKWLWIGGGFGALVIFAVLLATGVIPGMRKNIRAVELTMWGFDDRKVWEPVIRKYKELDSGIEVKYMQLSPANYETQMVNGLATGNGADIVMINNTWLARHGNKLMPAPAETITPAQAEELFPRAVVQDFTAGGAVYALPIYMDTLALIYNKDSFDKKGIAEPPASWLDFQEIVRKLGVGSAGIGGGNRTLLHGGDLVALSLMQAGVPMNDETGKADFKNGEGAIKFYTKFANPESSYYAWDNKPPMDIERFAAGKLPMMFGYYRDFKELHSSGLTFRFGAAPMPQSARTFVNYPSYAGLAVWSRSAHPIEAWEFIRAITTNPELALLYQQAANVPPALRMLIGEFEFDANAGMFARQILTARSWFQIDSAATGSILSVMVESIQDGIFSVAEALRRAEETINGL